MPQVSAIFLVPPVSSWSWDLVRLRSGSPSDPLRAGFSHSLFILCSAEGFLGTSYQTQKYGVEGQQWLLM